MRLTLLFALLLVSVAAFVVGCGKREGGRARSREEVVLRSTDGIRLGATLYAPGVDNPPGLVLVHAAGSNREAWEPFAVKAQRAGYMCVAIDLRGHGESVSGVRGERLLHNRFSTEQWLAALGDIDAALEFLIERGADRHNLAAAGAGVGANLVLRYAVDAPLLQAVVLLSPGLEYQGITTERAIVEYGKRPVMFVAGEGDRYALKSAGTLAASAPGFSELREYPTAAHGLDLLASVPNVTDQILVWLEPIIGPDYGEADE